MTKKGTNTSKKIKIYVNNTFRDILLLFFLRFFLFSSAKPFSIFLYPSLHLLTDDPLLSLRWREAQMLRSSPIMKIMKSVILSFLENSGFFRRSKVSTRASRWQISSPHVFPYPFEFPSRNKKENAAEIIFVSKESAFLLHFPRVLTHNRKTEREEHRQTQTRAETRSSSNRTNET